MNIVRTTIEDIDKIEATCEQSYNRKQILSSAKCDYKSYNEILK